MSINTFRSEDLMSKRKIASDLKNNTSQETFANSGLASSKGKTYKAVREKEDKILMTNLHTMSDEDYFEDLWNSIEV